MKQWGSELFFTDAEGVRQDEGLHMDGPMDPVAYARSGAKAALSIGLARELVVKIYGAEAVAAPEEDPGRARG